MDVVEAIDAWIDEQIDDLTDDELEVILEILDAVSASPLANVDADDVYDDDIAELVELTGGSADERAHTDTVLRSALFGVLDDDSVDEADETPADDTEDADADTSDEIVAFDDPDDDIDDADAGEIDESDDDLEARDPGDRDEPDDEFSEDPAGGDATESDNDLSDEHDDEADGESDARDDDHDEFLSDLADAERVDQQLTASDGVVHKDFLADVAGTRSDEPITTQAAFVRPVELREFDELGPSFLPEISQSARKPRRSRRLSDILLPAFMIVGLAVFAFGMVQLINSLNEDEAIVASGAEEPTATTAPEPTAAPTEVPPPPATVDPSAPTPTPTPDPTPVPRIGIQLVTGDVMIASFPDINGPPEISRLYDVSDEDLAPARQLTWLADGLGIVDTDGNVLIVDPDARRPEPTIIYEAGGGFGEAIKIASVDGQVAVLTEDGDITLTPSNGRADPDVIQVAWDAGEEGAKATDMTGIGSVVPFVLDDGNAQMIVTSDDNAVIPIWVTDEQPSAFNVGGSPAGILLGVGQGAVARYSLDADPDQILASVWDPFTRDDEPAIGYSSAGTGTAIVTGNGAIVLADDSGGGPLLWDPEVTEIRAFIALGTETQVVVLLETGSVVRIPLDPDALIESIWDITDETLSPANQVVVEPAVIADPSEG